MSRRARECLIGAWLAGTVLSAGTALHHKLAHVLGGLGLPHAETHAIMLPHVMRFNLDAAPEAKARPAGRAWQRRSGGCGRRHVEEISASRSGCAMSVSIPQRPISSPTKLRPPRSLRRVRRRRATCANCWPRRIEIFSLPLVGRAGWGSGGDVRASTVARNLATPPYPSPQGGGVKNSIQYLIRDAALDHLAPARAFAADEGIELIRRARLWRSARPFPAAPPTPDRHRWRRFRAGPCR